MLTLLLALWMWDRVLTECTSVPNYSPVVSYYWLATVRLTVPAICFDDQGQPVPCLATIPGEPLRFGPDIPDPGEGATVSTTADPVDIPEMLPTPPVGGLAAWPWFASDNPNPVVAVDAAGNESGACP